MFTASLPGNRRRIVPWFAWRGPHRKHFSLYCCHVLKEVFTGRRIETAVLLLLPVFVVVRMFTDIRLLLRNLATDSLRRICLCGNLFTNRLPSNGCTYKSIKTAEGNWVLRILLRFECLRTETSGKNVLNFEL
jgi:hypothetical protein